MSDNVTPPSGKPADLTTTVAILGALTHLVERMTGAGQPASRIHEPRQAPQRPGPAPRDAHGRFVGRKG